MTVSAFIALLTAFSTVTGLVTEAIKKSLSGCTYSANLIAIITAAVVGICGTGIYYVFCGIPVTAGNIICMILMGAASAVGAMVGYDKVVQMISQIRGDVPDINVGSKEDEQ